MLKIFLQKIVTFLRIKTTNLDSLTTTEYKTIHNGINFNQINFMKLSETFTQEYNMLICDRGKGIKKQSDKEIKSSNFTLTIYNTNNIKINRFK
jgi:hypothetical protein